MDMNIRIREKGLPEVSFIYGKFAKKGLLQPSDCIKVLDDVKNMLQKKDMSREVNWLITKPNVLAMDPESGSIIVVIPDDTYYIPFVSKGNETLIFECKLPKVIGYKKLSSTYLYYSDDEVITLDSNVYPLKIGHVNNYGSVCLGTFNSILDFDNPGLYFKELICYPVRHAEDVKTLRDVQANGFKKIYENKRILKTLL